MLWRFSWRFRKVLKRNNIPRKLVKELNSIYTRELRRKLRFPSIRNLLM